MKISIALCTYNGERFLREQLDSISRQTRLPDEVVIGDDCSTDKTLEILESWLHSIKSTQKTCRHLQYLQRFHSHFGRRIRTEENLIRNFGSFFREFITGGYFRFRQPVRSILFDLKEGLSRK